VDDLKDCDEYWGYSGIERVGAPFYLLRNHVADENSFE